jgi:hypothetical protein
MNYLKKKKLKMFYFKEPPIKKNQKLKLILTQIILIKFKNMSKKKIN